MNRRVRTASNRHWIFIKEKILSPLNDRLAVRHGAEYQFEVPEGSFDWDVEFSAVKDRSGNNLREQYMTAWVQPALVAPGNAVYQLGVKINWKNHLFYDNQGKNEDLNQSEVDILMAKTDEVLGSPIKVEQPDGPKEEVVEQRPDSVTNQKTTSITNQKTKNPDSITNQKAEEKLTLSSDKKYNNRTLIVANLLKLGEDQINSKYVASPVKEAISALKIINNSKSLDSIDMQQVEVQSAYDKLADLRDQQETGILGSVVKVICDKLKSSQIQDAEVYDILSRIASSISDNARLILSPDQKIQAIKGIENDIMNLLNDQGISKEIVSYLQGISADRIKYLLKVAESQFKALRDQSMDLDLTNIPAPQVVEEYVEDLQNNPII
jgi:hypothetical protein